MATRFQASSVVLGVRAWGDKVDKVAVEMGASHPTCQAMGESGRLKEQLSTQEVKTATHKPPTRKPAPVQEGLARGGGGRP
jgi:hypothetical protein